MGRTVPHTESQLSSFPRALPNAMKLDLAECNQVESVEGEGGGGVGGGGGGGGRERSGRAPV